MITLVDSHCHLPLLETTEDFPAVDDVLSNARELGVTHILCVSVDFESYPRIRALTDANAQVFGSVGVHPNSQDGEEAAIDRLVKEAHNDGVVAIGETGLDYFRSSGDLEWQRERFRVHIRAARESRKPLIIHSRDSAADVIRLLREEHADEVGGVMHCFVDDWETAVAAMEMNFFISFSGIVTFKNARQVQEVARKVPLQRLLVETDSPYLAPVPYRGKTNQPAYVRYVAEYLAELRGISLETLAAATTDNFFKLFSAAQR